MALGRVPDPCRGGGLRRGPRARAPPQDCVLLPGTERPAQPPAACTLERQLQGWALGSWNAWAARAQRSAQAALLRPVLGLADREGMRGGEVDLDDVRAELPAVLGDAAAAAGHAARLGLPVPQALVGLALESDRLGSMAGQLQGLLAQLRQVCGTTCAGA